MKICFLGPANNYHIKKWCNWFLNKGHEVHLVTFVDDIIHGVKIHYIDTKIKPDQKDKNKIGYLFTFLKIRKIIKSINPDIINVHYASSYGSVMALTGIKDYILSMWGSDIYDFPKRSLIHSLLIRFSLFRARHLFSTSAAMALEASKYTNKNIVITPFGVDVDLFRPDKNVKHHSFIVGTVKALEDKYGIDYLLKAIALIHKSHPHINIQLRIAGKGSKEQEYKQMAKYLGINDVTQWLGFISQDKAAEEWAKMDVGVVYSTLESFGVSAVECNSCGTAVIISNIPGLMEATLPDVTSYVVEKSNEKKLAEAILRLYYDDNLRNKLGDMGRKYVIKHFEINSCFCRIEKLFCDYIDDKKEV